MNINEALMVIPRSLISIICLFIVTKIIGKRQVSELSLFDYTIGISIGNFIAEMIINLDTQFIDGVVAMFVFGIVAYIVNLLTLKSIHFRRILSGTPTIIIDNGKLIESGLKKANIDIHDLLTQCRLQGYYDINELSYAIMECNGSISFLPKSEYKPVELKDLKIKSNKEKLTSNIIVDGHYMEDAIKESNITKDYIIKEMKKENISKIDEILLATYNDNKITFYKKGIKSKNYSLIE